MNFKLETLHDALKKNESTCVESLLDELAFTSEQQQQTEQLANHWIKNLRKDNFLSAFDLSSDKGIALMCLAEALLRIPDTPTVDALIADKITQHHWFRFLAPMTRAAAKQAMELLDKKFVLGETIEEALMRSQPMESKGYLFSYDMLGESACTLEQADYYFKLYKHAIERIGKDASISIKLTALSPTFRFNRWKEQFVYLYPKLKELALLAKHRDVEFTIDAEEADKLELTLTLLQQLAEDHDLSDWQGLGIAVQAYQKRALAQLDFLLDLAKRTQRKLKIRLVKGAYWDYEIKQAQIMGLPYYPVYTRKMSTDVSYMVCVQKMIKHADIIYPQFATHNAYTAAFILNQVPKGTNFEMQRLQGMGESLYDQLLAEEGLKCRVYAPVGGHRYLLAYLVRRLLENGANTSFIHQAANVKENIDTLVQNPAQKLRELKDKENPSICLPTDIFMPERKNSMGINVTDVTTMKHLQAQLNHVSSDKYITKSITHEGIQQVFLSARKAYFTWHKTSVQHRAKILHQMADTLEKHHHEFIALLISESGKTLLNAINEVREAVDYCRYYAEQAEKHFTIPETLPSVTGECNQIVYQGRGVLVTISPWNFPLAIFTGQLAAALVSGNTVIAKPSKLTPIIVHKAVQLFYEAGLPRDVLQLVLGSGDEIGDTLLSHPDVAGVMFTGSTQVAHTINQTLAKKTGPIVPFVAETGGQNAMIVDSSALLEQVTQDIIVSAFDSAGQRCSSLRVLFIQEDIYDALITLIKGAMDILIVGNPSDIATDIGPVIDVHAQQQLNQHIALMRQQGFSIYQSKLNETAKEGCYVPPTLIEIDTIKTLHGEVFGPILHVLRFKGKKLDETVNEINSTGFGLTFGMHSRIQNHYAYIAESIHAGNIYVNRTMIGAVVGSQPFGGQGLSGTGPKAGGPHYLFRLVNEKVISINTAAMGGNASLLSLED